jgi:hypothetical protein
VKLLTIFPLLGLEKNLDFVFFIDYVTRAFQLLSCFKMGLPAGLMHGFQSGFWFSRIARLILIQCSVTGGFDACSARP